MNVLEFHMIHSVPTSNINRGEDGDVKTAIFGGTTRHRVSSQCWKRSIRQNIQKWCQENAHQIAFLTKKIEDHLKTKTTNHTRLNKILKSIKFDADALMFLSEYEIEKIADYVNGSTSEDEKELKEILKEAKKKISLDVALFGRLFAANQDLNVYGAVKVSHAISTHSVMLEDDYFTAVDDLNTLGAGHIGHNSYLSSVLYRYVAIDIDQLKENLPDVDIKTFIPVIMEKVYTSFPTGKENSFAAYTLPEYVNVILKNGQPYQHVNAFESGVSSDDGGFIKASISEYISHKEQKSSEFDTIILDNDTINVPSFKQIISNVIGSL